MWCTLFGRSGKLRQLLSIASASSGLLTKLQVGLGTKTASLYTAVKATAVSIPDSRHLHYHRPCMEA